MKRLAALLLTAVVTFSACGGGLTLWEQMTWSEWLTLKEPMKTFRAYRDSPNRGNLYQLDWSTDGCSVGTPGFNFNTACHRHDFGWRNLKRVGQYWPVWDGYGGWNKLATDRQLRQDMDRTCDVYYNGGGFTTFFCRLEVAAGYRLVRLDPPYASQYALENDPEFWVWPGHSPPG